MLITKNKLMMSQRCFKKCPPKIDLMQRSRQLKAYTKNDFFDSVKKCKKIILGVSRVKTTTEILEGETSFKFAKRIVFNRSRDYIF